MKSIRIIGLLAFGVCFTVGCQQTTPKSDYKSVIESFYQSHPACLWASERTFPLTASAEEAKDNGYDALADQGLLTHKAAKRHETTFDLSATGKQFWVADPNQPGAGNICYGHRQVVSIDNASPTADQPGYRTIVSYHYTIADAPEWASAPEIKAAFPKLNSDTTPQMSIATLSYTNKGWQMNPPAGQAASVANPPAAPSGKGRKKAGAAS